MKVVVAAVVIGIGLRIIFLCLAPFENNQNAQETTLLPYNDERAHYNYILYIIETGRLPSQYISITETVDNSQASFENYQPPLYYLIAAPVVALWQRSSPKTAYLAGRIVSLLFGLSLLGLLFLIGKTSGISDTHIGSMLIVGSLLGSIIRFSVLISNDSLCWLFAGLMTYYWLRADVNSSNKRYYLLWTLALVGGFYTKFSILLMAPLPFMGTLLKKQWKTSITWFGLFIIAGILSLPVWLRTHQIFGSILSLSAAFGNPDGAAASLFSVFAYALRSSIFPWQEYWGGPFGGILILFITATCVIFIIMAHSEFRKVQGLPNYFLLLLASIAGFVWLNMHYFQAEGRYLLIAWPAWILFLAMGGRTPRTQRGLFILLLLPYLLFIFPFGD